MSLVYKLDCGSMEKISVVCFLESLLKDSNFESGNISSGDEFMHLNKNAKIGLSRKDFERCKAFVEKLDKTRLTIV